MDQTQFSPAYRRAVALSTPTPGRIVAAMEDDFHHFRVTLQHEDGRVTAIAGESIRHPWSLCPAASDRLQALVGAPLTSDLVGALSREPIREHCTHQYDLACAALVHAARGASDMRYDMTVADRIDDRTRARLWRDGEPLLDWLIEGTRIVSPVEVSLKREFADAVSTLFDGSLTDAAIMLRRAAFVSGGRRRDLDEVATAADGARNMGGCFVMSAGVAELATRMHGATRDFANGPAPLGEFR